MVRVMFAAALLALPGLVRADDDKSKADTSKLVGTWNVTACEKDGKALTSEDCKDKQVKITSDTITCYDKNGKVEMACKYTVDSTKNPWRVTMTCTEGEYKGKKCAAIMQLDGDTLRCCHSKPDKDAPTEFKTKADQCCVTLRRAK